MVEGQVAADFRQGGEGRALEQQRGAVRGGLHHRLRADGARGAGAVLDDEGLAEALAHAVLQDARDGVGHAAGAVGHDQPDRPVGPGALGARQGRQREPGEGEAASRESDHPRFPFPRALDRALSARRDAAVAREASCLQPAASSFGRIGGMPATLFDRIWDPHVVADLGGGWSLLHCDRVLLHDLSGARALREVGEDGYALARPDLVFATPDHAVSSAPGRTGETFPEGGRLLKGLRARAKETGIRLFDLGQDGNGIVHVMGPELGIVLPGTVLVCGDSHTCTNGGVGALAFGIGASEVKHVLATQTLPQKKPRSMRIRFEGAAPPGVTPKDMILAAIGRFGAGAGTGMRWSMQASAVGALYVRGGDVCTSPSRGRLDRHGSRDETDDRWMKGRDFAPRGPVPGTRREAAGGNCRATIGRCSTRSLVENCAKSPRRSLGHQPEQVVPVFTGACAPSDAANPSSAPPGKPRKLYGHDTGAPRWSAPGWIGLRHRLLH